MKCYCFVRSLHEGVAQVHKYKIELLYLVRCLLISGMSFLALYLDVVPYINLQIIVLMVVWFTGMIAGILIFEFGLVFLYEYKLVPWEPEISRLVRKREGKL